VSTGSYLPTRAVTNAELASLGAPLADEEIVRLSGIRERRFAAPEEATSDLATHAVRQALERARLSPEQVDRLMVATVSPDHLSPSSACFVHRALGLGPVPVFDVTASCSGFLYVLDLAARAVATGDSHVLAVAADIRSRYLNLKDRATCALFGDGAAAALVARGPQGRGLLGIGLSADGRGAKSVYVPAGGSREPATAETIAGQRHTIRMEEGPQVYLTAVDGMLATAEALLGKLGLSFADIDLVVPHQPNRRILDRIAKIARLPPAKMMVTIERIGNVSGATCGLTLDEALVSGRAQPGMKLLLLAAGAGYTAGAAVLEVDEALANSVQGGAHA
jgi:3-oxoacyl-[acyl-carrier-protein] synthase-3